MGRHDRVEPDELSDIDPVLTSQWTQQPSNFGVWEVEDAFGGGAGRHRVPLDHNDGLSDLQLPHHVRAEEFS